MKPIKIKISKQVMVFGLSGKLKKLIKSLLTYRNPIWESNHKMGRYNRGIKKDLKAYTLSPSSINVPIGFLTDLDQLLIKNKIPHKFYFNRQTRMTGFKCDIQLRGYQQFACKDILMHNNGILQAPTGSGKTVMALWIIASRKQNTLIIVHTKELMEQWVDRASTFLKIPSYEIGIIGDGKYRIGRRLTVGLIQSIYKKIEELKKEFGQVVVDECHKIPSRTFTEAVSGFYAKYLLGLSATPYRSDKLDNLIYWYVGPIRHVVEKEKLIEENHIAEPSFIMRATSFEPESDPITEYSTMISELTSDVKRNQLILKDVAKNRDDVCLILSDRKEHCEILQHMLKKEYALHGEVLTGSTPDIKRAQIVRKVNSGKVNFLFATGQLIGEGFDCKELNVLFLTTPIKYAGRLIQYIGRIMRPNKSGKNPIVYDYVDWEVGPLIRSARSRIEVYGKNKVKHI